MPITGVLDPINVYAPPAQLHLWLWLAAFVCAFLAVACLFTAARPWTAYLYRYSIFIAAAGLMNCIAALGSAIIAIFLR